MTIPSVAVVITTHNRPQLLRRAVASVLTQTASPREICLVDDGSAPEAAARVQQLAAETGLELLRHETARGVAAARNSGWRRTTGEWVAFLDDDDEWRPYFLQRLLDRSIGLSPADRRRTAVVYCGCEVHLTDEERVTLNLPRIDGDIRTVICRQGLATIPSSGLYRRQALAAIGGLDETLRSSVDHDLWMSLAAHGFHARAVGEALVVTRQAGAHRSMVTDTAPRIAGVEQYLQKWRPTLIDWLGRRAGGRYVRDYRLRVLGNLAALKLAQGDLRASAHLFGHLLRHHGTSPPAVGFLFWLLLRRLLRQAAPRPLLEWRARLQGARP
jgi:glycosyltransferase involved in cell wall biosynthesis